MLSIQRNVVTVVGVLLFWVTVAPEACAAVYPGFTRLKEAECSPISNNSMKDLPIVWQKYVGFVKSCPLKPKGKAKAKFHLVSVWAHDYINNQDGREWESFPRPIVVDSQMRTVGQLPENYPQDWVTHLIVYSGKWQSGIPGEILVDVSNPAVSGDYHYPPLRWGKKAGRYFMESEDPISGSRRNNNDIR